MNKLLALILVSFLLIGCSKDESLNLVGSNTNELLREVKYVGEISDINYSYEHVESYIYDTKRHLTKIENTIVGATVDFNYNNMGQLSKVTHKYKSIETDDDNYVTKTYTFIYLNTNTILVKEVITRTRSNNIEENNATLTIDTEGKLIRCEYDKKQWYGYYSFTCLYDIRGNLIRTQKYDGHISLRCKYDDKPGIGRNINIPQWFIIYSLPIGVIFNQSIFLSKVNSVTELLAGGNDEYYVYAYKDGFPYARSSHFKDFYQESDDEQYFKFY